MIHDKPVSPPWHIASYPRSGNHLVRALIEFASHQPTTGCPGSHRDSPIHSRAANVSADLIRMQTDRPIACKSHFLDQVLRHEHELHASRFLLITRNPVAAISSHLARDLSRWPFTSTHSLRRLVMREVNTYLSLLYAYRSYREPLRYHVRFEDLTAGTPRALPAANALLQVVAPAHPPLLPEQWDMVQTVAKDSQTSLKPRQIAARERISPLVAERLQEPEMLHFLQSGMWL